MNEMMGLPYTNFSSHHHVTQTVFESL